MLKGVQSHQIDEAWPQIEHLVRKALEQTGSISDYDPDDIKDLCKAQHMQCWVVYSYKPIAVAITRILIFPKRKVFSVFLTASDPHTMRDWFQYIDILKAYGRSYDCEALRIGGRLGWVKIFKPTNVTASMTLPIGNE